MAWLVAAFKTPRPSAKNYYISVLKSV